VQVTRDHGAHWTDATPTPDDSWISRVYASRFEPGTAYVTKSRRRQDDFHPIVFRTADYGATWTRLTTGLPDSAETTSIVEDTVNPNLLFLGTSAGVFVSFDRGQNWIPFRSNMAPAPVTDLLVHPREGDLVVGTYGRGIWITNIVPLRGLNRDVLSSDAALLPIRSFTQRNEGALGNYRLLGDRYPFTPNEPNGITIAYYLKSAGKASIEVADNTGKVVTTLDPPSHAGMNQTVWTARATPGEYTFTLHAAGKTYIQKATLNH